MDFVRRLFLISWTGDQRGETCPAIVAAVDAPSISRDDARTWKKRAKRDFSSSMNKYSGLV
jgi:hypothetical protein